MEESYRKMWLMEIEHGHEQCSRIIELEQLCRDLWKAVDKPGAYFDNKWHWAPTIQPLYDRMAQLGLLEGSE